MFSKKFELNECHRLFDGRLAISALAIIVAGIALLEDYMHPHPKSRNVLLICVPVYFMLTSILTAYMTYVEKGIYYVGKKVDPTGLDAPDVWYLSSNVKKYVLEIYLSGDQI